MKKRGVEFGVVLRLLASGLIAALVSVVFNAGGQSIDLTFNPGTGFNSTPSVIALRSDSGILVGGSFNQYNGTMRRGVARMLADGTLDSTFDPMEGPNGPVRWLFPLADGKVVIAGDFSSVNSITRPFLARLRADGSVDLSYPVVSFNGSLSAVAMQADAKVVCAGVFNQVNGTNRFGMARINTDGTLDLSFGFGAGYTGSVSGIAPLSNGQLLVFGDFVSLGGFNQKMLVRLFDNGIVDTNFALPFINGTQILSVKEQPDGKLLICGEFTSIDGYSRIRVARLHGNGSVDLSFYTPLGIGNPPSVITADQNGHVFVGGSFSTVSGNGQQNLTRLNSDGTFDALFRPQINGSIPSLIVQPDGRLLVCGVFTTVNGTNINRIVRLNSGGILAPGVSLLSARLYPAMFLEAPTGITYRIEYITNLTNAAMWVPLTNVNLSATPQMLIDTTWTNSRQRFYRALSLPPQ